MKNLHLWVIALTALVVLASCKKSETCLINEPDDALQGRWNYAAHYYSIGSPGDWHPVPAGQWIELRSNGTVVSSVTPYSSAATYQVMDSMHLKFIIKPGRDSLLYLYSLRGDTLELSPYAPMCVEGCADRFLRKR